MDQDNSTQQRHPWVASSTKCSMTVISNSRIISIEIRSIHHSSLLSRNLCSNYDLPVTPIEQKKIYFLNFEVFLAEMYIRESTMLPHNRFDEALFAPTLNFRPYTSSNMANRARKSHYKRSYV